MGQYVGLDAHSRLCVYAIQDEEGRMQGEGSVSTTPLGLSTMCARHDLAPGTAVALESGTMAFYVARRLAAIGMAPVVIDAREVRSKALRPNQKSDRRDAIELCEGLRRGTYRTVVHVPSIAIEQLRETLGRRRHFVRVKTMQVNAVKRLLRTAGLQHLCTHMQLKGAWAKLTTAVAFDPSLHQFVEAHHALWQCAHDQIQVLEASLDQQAEGLRPDFERLQTVPGVGRIVALTVLAVFSDVRRFPTTKHAASYAGLVASSYDSGDRVQHGRITRRGSSELRAMLCEAAHHAWRPDNPFHPFFNRLCARRGYKLAVVALAHRLCRILYAMLHSGTEFDIQKLAVEEGRFEHVQVHRYRLKRGQSKSA